MKGKLYLIPVSLGDSPAIRYAPSQNVELVSRLSHFVVESARTARRCIRSLCPEKDLDDLLLLEVDKHKGYSYPRERVMTLLGEGVDVGFMSEAGCPCVADPGSIVVADCHKAGFDVVPLVGPSSIILSLMASGFSGQSFAFHGYLPFDGKERRQALGEAAARVRRIGETQIFIEAPYRNDRLLRELVELLPSDLSLCMAVDLTTDQEEIHRMTISEWRQVLSRESSWHKRPAIFLIGQ